jgi:hypothetical protein
MVSRGVELKSVQKAFVTAKRAPEKKQCETTTGVIIANVTTSNDPVVGFTKPRIVEDTSVEPPMMGEPAVATIGKVFYGGESTAIAPPDTIRMPEPIIAGRDTGTLYGIAGGVSSSYVKITKLQTVIDTMVSAIKDTIAAVLPDAFAQDDVVKICPNPIARGGTIRLAWGTSGRYAAALLDLHGQIQEERELVVAGKGQIDEWSVQQRLAPGIYFLRVSRPGKRAVTKEVVIQ